jgi:hypothetical protein
MYPHQISASDNFFEVSKKIAKNFLQSVVVVDDQATFEEKEPEKLSQDAKEAVPNVRGGRGMKLDSLLTEPLQEEAAELTTAEAAEDISGVLNVKRLNDCFAEMGLICSVLKPSEEEAALIVTKADHVARRADIVVFDWILIRNEEAGTTALKSIHGILKEDVAQADDSSLQPRTRLIAIYTSFPALDAVVAQTKRYLAEKGMDFTNHDDFTLVNGLVKIAFYRKNRGSAPSAAITSRTLGEKELIDHLIDDFTEMTYGLLSNIALASLGALRENTHRVLRKFERRLDAPYLSHRTMVSPADEAQQHPVPLLTAEFNDVLEDSGVDGNASVEMIEKWLDHQIAEGEISFAGKVEGLTDVQLRSAFLDLVKHGVDAEYEKLKASNLLPKWKKVVETASRSDKDSAITSLLIKDATAASRDLDFAILTTIRSRYEKPEPLLTLGSIVAKRISDKDEYYVCIQPVCDSVRLKRDTIFPFLKLHNSAEPNDEGKISPKFGIVVCDNSEYKKLRVSLKPRDISLENLKFQALGEIRAEQNPQQPYSFETVGEAANLRWIGNLKFAHAQRIANDFAREVSRVGLVESDWLRRVGG